MEEEVVNQHRKFIHDVANDLTILDGSISKVAHLLKNAGKTEADEEIQKLQKAQDRVKGIIQKLKSYREFIHSLQD